MSWFLMSANLQNSVGERELLKWLKIQGLQTASIGAGNVRHRWCSDPVQWVLVGRVGF